MAAFQIKLLRVLLLLLPLLLCPGFAAADPEWTMVWDDEFNGAANTPPDPTRWTYDLGGGGWGNGELETYTNSTANSYQDGAGHLVISAIDNGGNYTSARIKTETLFNQAYGRIEASLQLPAGGSGVWPAFWMLGDTINNVGWPACGEIDMMENIAWPANEIGGHIHGPVNPGGGDYNGGSGVGTDYILPSGDFNNSYHIFAAEWNPTQIVFYVDGTAYQTINASSLPAGGQWVFNHPFFILLNLAVGGVSGSPSGTAFPQQMFVDYVRVYKLTDNSTSPYGGTAPTVPGTVQAENYDSYTDSTDPTEPGEGFAYNALQATNTSGQYRSADAISIEDCTDTGGGYDVDYTSPGQWLQYTVNVTQSGVYTLDARVASDETGGTFHFDMDGTAITAEMTAPNTGGWQNWQDVTASGISITAGQHVFLLVEDSMGGNNLGVCNFNYFTLSLPAAATPTRTVTPSFTPTYTPTFTVTTVPPVCASWITNGNAFASGKGVTLTTAVNGETGSAWNSTCINLSQNFNMTFQTYFGAPGGADGMDFVLQNDPRSTTALGSGGGNKGYAGAGDITPSVAFDLETYNNNGTLQMLENGSSTNTCGYATSSCPYVFPNNVANQSEHSYQVVWNTSAKTLTLIFDGVVVMTYNRDLINAVFGGNTCVYYGFTGATGGSNNLQYVYEVGCTPPTATVTSTPTSTNTLSQTPTRTLTNTSSPTPTFSPSVTLTRSQTSTPTTTPSLSTTPTSDFSPSRTGTLTAIASASTTPTPSVPLTQTPSPNSSTTMTSTPMTTQTTSPSVTASVNPSLSPTFTPTTTLSQSHTETSTPSVSPSATPTQSLTPTLTPSFTVSATPSLTLSPSSSATETINLTPTETATGSLTSTPTLTFTEIVTLQSTASPSPTVHSTTSDTPTPSLAPKQSPTAPPSANGTNVILRFAPVPNPNPTEIRVELNGSDDTLTVKIYAHSMVCVAEVTTGPCNAGWVTLVLPPDFVHHAANGVYFYRIESNRAGSDNLAPAVGSLMIAR